MRGAERTELALTSAVSKSAGAKNTFTGGTAFARRPGAGGKAQLPPGLPRVPGFPAALATPSLVYFLFFMLVVSVWGSGWAERHPEGERTDRKGRWVKGQQSTDVSKRNCRVTIAAKHLGARTRRRNGRHTPTLLSACSQAQQWLPSRGGKRPKPHEHTRACTCMHTHTHDFHATVPTPAWQAHTPTSRPPCLLFPRPGPHPLHTSAPPPLTPPPRGSANTTCSARPAWTPFQHLTDPLPQALPGLFSSHYYLACRSGSDSVPSNPRPPGTSEGDLIRREGLPRST